MIADYSACSFVGVPPKSRACTCTQLFLDRTLALWALLLLFLSNCLAQSNLTYTIATVAGSGQEGTSSAGEDGRQARSVHLNFPSGIALDYRGNLYFADFSARIRKVALQNGRITTVAGTGTRGYSGDGGPATSAQLGGPGDVAVDGAGNIYFADGSNHRIRRIAADTGIITTIAGDGSAATGIYTTFQGRTVVTNIGDDYLAVKAPIGMPAGLAVDVLGNLFFTNGGDMVRRVAADTGIITRVAGAGGSYHSGDGGPAVLAQLHQPSKVALDGAGNIYIAARGEHRIRKIRADSDIITTIAGTSLAEVGPVGLVKYLGGFSGDGGPATEALLNDPGNIAVDTAGNVYISDVLNYRIRRIDANTGLISTIAGTGIKGYGGDGGPALKAQISTPSGIAIDGAGQIYFGDQANHRIRVLVPIL